MSIKILSNEIDNDTKNLIEKVEIIKKQLSQKDDQIISLKNEAGYLKLILDNRNKTIFGSSSERVNLNQLSFFNEAEKDSNSNTPEPTVEEITYKRKKKVVTSKTNNLANLERITIQHRLQDEEHIVYSYACKSWEKQRNESNIVSAEILKTIFYNSTASNELIAYTISLKY